MITRDFDYDLLTGRKELFHYDETDDTFTIEELVDVEHLIEENKALFNSERDSKAELRRVASIPLIVYMQLQEQGISPDQDAKAFRRWLNDGDNRFFRTSDERV